ncbi:MAG: nickel pincer cofactor biosynthesis protein LarC [Syntrophomonadaceae bacterium]|nr:nickel pincer cofactor biosynthesis protein LarC [Syntrophomonadaceae bacterium]
MKALYLDCFSGVSGDMMLGGFLALGTPLAAVQQCIDKLKMPAQLREHKVVLQGISASGFSVNHNQKSLRRLRDILQLLKESDLPESVKVKAAEIFRKLARTEAAIHGIDAEEVHFHEVGAVDTVVDVVGTLFCLDYWDISEVYCSPVPWSPGLIKITHGNYPLPAPAAASLLQGAPCYGVEAGIELITPTGAVLISALVKSFGNLPAGRVEKVAYGAGNSERTDHVPNVLRMVLMDLEKRRLQEEEIALLETQIDDMTAETLGFVCAELQKKSGVKEVFTNGINMKKGRLGTLLSVICLPGSVDEISDYMLNHTSSLGIRISLQTRRIVERSTGEIPTPWGIVRIKKAQLPDGRERFKPEADDCQRIAVENQIPLADVYAYVEKKLGKGY